LYLLLLALVIATFVRTGATCILFCTLLSVCPSIHRKACPIDY